MSTETPPTAFGRIFAPRVDWLARAPAEEVIDPGLAIVDTHHHLWRAPGRYLVDDLFADTSTGHNVEATVFVECRQGYESNFPVDKMGIGYRALWNAFKRIAAQASLEEKVALFSDTARHVYRLG